MAISDWHTAVSGGENSPVDIGADIFLQQAMPALVEAFQGKDLGICAQVYRGFLSAAIGAIEAELGKNNADAFILGFAESYIRSEPLEGAMTQ